ncbi:MAG TPA: hypothetical protein ENH65_11260, partial [Candidatus Aminicenantes bacterium]|nr:hypothetical protein [Candidatus Aminicenantes bacterium]
MKPKYLLLIILLVFGISSNVYAVSYWVIQKNTQRLLHIQKDADKVTIVESYTVIDSQADYAVNPKDNTCWVTSAFQGQVRRYGKAEPIVVSSFGAPMSLALDAERQIMWVADGALNKIVKMRLDDGTLEKHVQLSTPSRSIASRADGGLWIATKYGLIVLNSDGEVIKEFERKAKYLSSGPGKNSVWLVNPVDNNIMHLDGDGNILAEGKLKTLSGLIATKDGGCVLLGREVVFQLDADGDLIGTMQGLDHPSRIVYQPEDESVWILHSRDSQLVQLPMKTGQKPLTVIAGLGRGNLRVEPAEKIQWISEAIEPESQQPETPEEEKPLEKIKVPEKIEPEKKDTTKPEVVPEKKDAIKPETEPEKKDTTKPKVEPEKKESAVKPEKQELKEMPKPTVVPAPTTSTLLSEPPKFKDGGVMLARLHEGLSSTRLKNVPQALGRRYVWNFEGATFTLLLGLSVEVYNSYTNRGRAEWVEMLAEGVHAAKPIAEEFKKLAKKHNWNAEQIANFVLSFVQCLPYTVDDVSTGIDEFPRFSIETLVAGGGDCEDTTILAGSIFLVLGYDIVCLNPKGHLALGIEGKFPGSYYKHNGKRYHYSETTG